MPLITRPAFQKLRYHLPSSKPTPASYQGVRQSIAGDEGPRVLEGASVDTEIPSVMVGGTWESGGGPEPLSSWKD